MAKKYQSFLCQIITLIFILSQLTLSNEQATPPPLPILPLPTHSQLKWQQREMVLLFHFGINTYTQQEFGAGDEDPAIFNPTALDTIQWIQTADQVGASLVLLTAKHHDGFCLWPSYYTDYSIIRSPWKDGFGDVVGEFVNSAKALGIDVGLYLSPWDRQDYKFATSDDYNEYYLAQLQELLNNYGSVKEIWFDGRKGRNGGNINCYFNEWFAMVKELQRTIHIFSGAGQDMRWIGNEKGFVGNTCWASIDRATLTNTTMPDDYLSKGDPYGKDWVPPVCEASIRTSQFWHKEEKPKSLDELLEIYYNSIGKNCLLVLNVPLERTGLVPDSDVTRLKEFRSAIEEIFSTNLGTNCSIKASSQRGDGDCDFGAKNVLDVDHLWTYWAPSNNNSGSYWIELTAKDETLKFNVVRIQEPIEFGQRIARYKIYVDGYKIDEGTTVGYKKLHRIQKGVVEGKTVKIKIIRSRAIPLISSIGLHFDPFWNPESS